jgi:Virulence factor BrkB
MALAHYQPLVSISVISLLFAMMFKWLPDADVDWYDVWLGAIVTAILFEIGKSAIYWKTRFGFHIRCGGINHCGITLGILLVANHINGRGSYPRLCQASWLHQEARQTT